MNLWKSYIFLFNQFKAFWKGFGENLFPEKVFPGKTLSSSVRTVHVAEFDLDDRASRYICAGFGGLADDRCGRAVRRAGERYVQTVRNCGVVCVVCGYL